MKLRIRHVFSLPFLFSLLLPVMAHATEFLQSGVPYQLSQSPDSLVSFYMIDVPSGSQTLSVTMRDGSGDLDLLFRKCLRPGPFDARNPCKYLFQSLCLVAHFTVTSRL